MAAVAVLAKMRHRPLVVQEVPAVVEPAEGPTLQPVPQTAPRAKQEVPRRPTLVAAVAVVATATTHGAVLRDPHLAAQADLELLSFAMCCQPCRHLTSQLHRTTVHHQLTTSQNFKHLRSPVLLR